MFIVSQEINETKILLLVANNATHFDIQSEIHKELFSHKTISFSNQKRKSIIICVSLFHKLYVCAILSIYYPFCSF